MDVATGNNGLRISAQDLTLDTELETEVHGVLTVRNIMESGITGKIRCQTPFRDSSSMAAFLSLNAEGKPFVYDVGTAITHWLTDADSSTFQLSHNQGIIAQVLARAIADCGAPFEPEALQALRGMKQQDPADHQRLRVQLKKINKNISVIQLDSLGG